MESLLRVRNLESGYGKLMVLKGVSLHVNKGEIVSIIGANGAGKTTLLKTLAGLIRPAAGSVSWKNTEISRISPDRLVFMGYSLVPEGRQVFPSMTVRENLFLGGFPLLRKKGRPAAARRMEEMFALFPRLAERSGQYGGTLSGGEQQMLAIARSLMSDPEFIMMDEPSLGLAPIIMRDIFRTIARLRELGTTVLLVEQNAKAALKVADRGYVLETGAVVLEGTAEELLANNDVQRAYLGKEYRSIPE